VLEERQSTGSFAATHDPSRLDTRMPAAIELAGVSKAFGQRPVLANVNLLVARGEIVALRGPNGAGKTTLLRICAAMLTPDAGSVWLGGRRTWPDRQAGAPPLGIVLDTQHTWHLRLSGRHNLEYFGAVAGLGRREALAAAVSGIAEARLGDVADLPVAAYSAGMRARLALVRARLRDPAVLLLDEPSAGLDAASVAVMTEQLRDGRRGTSVLMSTHDGQLPLALGARLLEVDDGEVTTAAPS
jgi:ABC-type multidrug transport system ATPase subunit